MRILFIYLICSPIMAQFNVYDFPFSPYQDPIHIRAKIILLTKNNGKGNFDLSDSDTKKDLLEYLENINAVFSNLTEPEDLSGCYTGNDFFSDTKIRFDFEIVEVKNEYGWDFTNTGCDLAKGNYTGFSPHSNWYLKSVDDSITNAEMKNKNPSIHIYFTTNGKIYEENKHNKAKDPIGKAAAQFPSISDFKRSSQIHSPNVWLKYFYLKNQAPEDYNLDWSEIRNWFVNSGNTRSLAHEIGHVLGLFHYNNYHNTNKCPYSIMSQKGAAPRNYLQPTEIRKIHWNLSHSNLMQFVNNDAYNNTTHLIYDELTIYKPTRWYGGMELSNKAKLIVKNKLILPFKSQIIMRKNSILQFEEKGAIFFPDGSEFTNIIKDKSAKIIYSKDSITNPNN